VDWAKSIELTKRAWHDKQHFDCATWLHNLKEGFQDPAEGLTGMITEPWRALGPSVLALCLYSLLLITGRRIHVIAH
jgi:hypothetical protein